MTRPRAVAAAVPMPPSGASVTVLRQPLRVTGTQSLCYDSDDHARLARILVTDHCQPDEAATRTQQEAPAPSDRSGAERPRKPMQTRQPPMKRTMRRIAKPAIDAVLLAQRTPELLSTDSSLSVSNAELPSKMILVSNPESVSNAESSLRFQHSRFQPNRESVSNAIRCQRSRV